MNDRKSKWENVTYPGSALVALFEDTPNISQIEEWLDRNAKEREGLQRWLEFAKSMVIDDSESG